MRVDIDIEIQRYRYGAGRASTQAYYQVTAHDTRTMGLTDPPVLAQELAPTMERARKAALRMARGLVADQTARSASVWETTPKGDRILLQRYRRP